MNRGDIENNRNSATKQDARERTDVHLLAFSFTLTMLPTRKLFYRDKYARGQTLGPDESSSYRYGIYKDQVDVYSWRTTNGGL